MYGRVPKVANSSIKAALCKLLSQPPDDGLRTTSDLFWRDATHGETTLISPLQARRNRGTHFSFSFVRNPFDRLVSAYNNKIVENSELTKPMLAMGLESQMSFSDFLSKTCSCKDDEMDVHLMPQSAILCAGDRLVPKFIGRLEYIHEDWPSLKRRMKREGFQALGRLPEKNRRRDSSQDLSHFFSSPKIVDLVVERYGRDLELFYQSVAVNDLISCTYPETISPIQKGRGSGSQLQS